VAKISGDAILTAAAHSVVVNNISIASIGYDCVCQLRRKLHHKETDDTEKSQPRGTKRASHGRY
jgi:hypothetical protein